MAHTKSSETTQLMTFKIEQENVLPAGGKVQPEF